MHEKIWKLTKEVKLFSASTTDEIEQFRIKYLGRKGIIQELFNQFKELSAEDKMNTGKILNEFKTLVNSKIEECQIQMSESTQKKTEGCIDLSIEAPPMPQGSRHPVSIVKNNIIDIFSRIGFTLSEGPEIVDDWHNFTALNFPEDHPARDMQDTFFISRDPDFLLRTHTSPVQVQEMLATKPPLRTISVGRVYRNETITYKSHVQFHQIEGLYVDENVSFADMKQVLYYFIEQFFGPDYRVRFRPSFFPFTEPSAEIDIQHKNDTNKWMEILGCGMVDPNVLENCGIDSSKYTAYAFGIGVERLALLKYGIKDIRTLFENDVRFLEQFVSE